MHLQYLTVQNKYLYKKSRAKANRLQSLQIPDTYLYLPGYKTVNYISIKKCQLIQFFKALITVSVAKFVLTAVRQGRQF